MSTFVCFYIILDTILFVSEWWGALVINFCTYVYLTCNPLSILSIFLQVFIRLGVQLPFLVDNHAVCNCV